jgi:FKBP-type peptidyl-prolyl cis-trans isomerase 2
MLLLVNIIIGILIIMAEEQKIEGIQEHLAHDRRHVKKTAAKKHVKKAAKSPETGGSQAEKQVEKVRASDNSTRNLIAGAFVILLIVAAIVYMGQNQTSQPTSTVTPTTIRSANTKTGVAENGDLVTVEYTGSFENGTIFDTTDKTIAEESNIYSSLRTYEPIKFTLGSGGLIQGFEDAIEGMAVGAQKSVVLPPEKAYGYPQPKLIQNVERRQRSPAVQNVTIDKFISDIGTEPVVGLEFKVPNNTGYQVTWPMKVLSVSNDTVTFRFMPGDKTTMKTVFGNALVYGVKDEIVIEINATVGQKILTRVGPAKVVDVNAENVSLDFNHELAGKNLKFKIKLVDDIKQ